MREAGMWARRRQELRLQVRRTEIDIGIAAIERGDYVEVDDSELDAYLDDLASSPYSETPT